MKDVGGDRRAGDARSIAKPGVAISGIVPQQVLSRGIALQRRQALSDSAMATAAPLPVAGITIPARPARHKKVATGEETPWKAAVAGA